MRKIQWRVRAAHSLEWLSGMKRLGIVARLSISFLAVAGLAVAANFLAGRSYIMHTTRVEQLAPVMRAAPAVETPRAASVPVPAVPEPAPVSVDTALEYSRTLQRFGAALWERAGSADVAADADFRNASAHLARTGSRLSGEVSGASRDLARKVLGKNKEVGDGALALIALADERHRVLDEYRQHLDQLNQSMKSALDGSFKIFGRFIAREYLLKLDQNLQKIRARLEDAIATDAAPVSLSALEASEREYSAVLDANRSSLEHVQGQPWLQSTQKELSILLGFRESLQRAHELYGEQRSKLTQQMSDAAVLSEECIAAMQAAQRNLAALAHPPATPLRAAEPAAPPAALQPAEIAVAESAPPPETTTITPSDEGRYALFVKITIGVVALVFIVSLLTALSIVRPVRRLVLAAAKLAAGETHIRVERGGMKELDQLAGSFNQMAQDLEVAGLASRSYQARLEDDVAARTLELRQLAERDPLTQLPNRRHGLTLMQRSLDQARSQTRFMGVCFVDLDNFKSINDSLGHAFGDQVLTQVAERLVQVSASFGAAMRLGGDEFCVIHDDAPSFDEIHRCGALLVQAFHTPIQIEQRELMVSVSCGLSVFPLHGETCAELLSSADAALYRAKSMGRNQASIYTADLLESAAERFSIEQRLRRAIERDEFELVFQPEVCVDSLRVGLVEALLRWRQPDGRLASPGEFLGVAETSGFIAEIDKWVLNAALEAASEWHHGAWPEARVAINVSSRQLIDPHFIERLKELMQQHRLPPTCVEIELTETVLQTGAATVATLHALKAEGFAIALDDFGTGYSSLTSLAQLPLSRVKLDRSLIAGHASDERSAAIARTTVLLCEHLQLEVTAEGIENAEQLEWLLNHDAVYLQGYLISRPLPFDEVAPSMDAIHQKMALHVLSLKSGTAPPAADDLLSIEDTRDAVINFIGA